MLERIKRKQLDGFMEFVENMETTGATKRLQIMTAGILEDPIFMSWVMKNMKTFDDFLTLPADDLEFVLGFHPQIITILAKSLFEYPQEKKDDLTNSVAKYASQIRDELSYLKEVSPQEKDSSKYFMIKSVRKLQHEEVIQGFGWKLPPMDIFYPKSYSDGRTQIFFESSILAASGDMLKNKREGLWEHYYDNGKLLARGTYSDGFKHGEWEFYYSNGKPRAKGLYFKDERGEMWQEWDRNGVQTESLYREGVKVDPDQSSSN